MATGSLNNSTFPRVAIVLGNGNLGGVTPTSDGVAGLVLSGEATDNIDQMEAVLINSPADLRQYGITEENNPLAVKEIKAFYLMAGEGAELWIMLVSDAMLLSEICDATTEGAPVRALLDAAQGRIRLLGVNIIPAAGYNPTIQGGIDTEVEAAVFQLQQMLDEYASAYKPARALIPGLEWTGSAQDLGSLREGSFNRVGVVLGADNESGSAAIALALGRLAGTQVHINLGRVKNGAVATEAYFTDGSTAMEKEAMWPSLHDKGFIFMRKYHGRNGYYFNDDPVAAPLTDDYSSISRGRVIDKALTIAYATYVEELMDNVEIDAKGQIDAAACKYYEGRINNAVNTLMAGEISRFRSFVDPAQNVLSTNRMRVVCAITPLGQLKEIIVELGFENPALASSSGGGGSEPEAS